MSTFGIMSLIPSAPALYFSLFPPDPASVPGLVSEVAGPVGLSLQQHHSPYRPVHLSVL